MASEFDNEIGKEQQQDAPQQNDAEVNDTAPQTDNNDLLPLEDEEQEIWGDDDEDLEPPPNPLEIEDEESRFIDDEGRVEEPQQADDEPQKEADSPLKQDSAPQVNFQQSDNPVNPQPAASYSGNPDDEYIKKNIDPSFIPGTNEFFEAVENEARSAVENSTGEEFDEFNPKHMSRYNYFISQCSQKREAEMHRGVEWCRRRDAKIVAEQNAQKVEKEFRDFLSGQITTPELANRFQQACDNLTMKQTREINAMIEKGDYSGVQKIIDHLKGQRGTSKPRYASQNPLPRRNVSNGSNAPKLSDIL